MKFIDFEVYDDNDNLIEALPAILYLNWNEIVAQVSTGTTSVTFTQFSTGKQTIVTVTNGVVILQPTANDTYRVGNPTISKHNEVTVTCVRTLSTAKQEKLAELRQKYIASYTTFQSSALGITKTYPIDTEAQANFKDSQDRLVADPNKNTFYFKTIEDGTFVQHTRTQFLQLLEDAEAFKVNKIQQFDAYEVQINSATDIVDIDGINISFI